MFGFRRRPMEKPNFNAIADRAVRETLHALTAEIGIVQLRELLDKAEQANEKYTTLAKLWFKHQERNYPGWRKK